MSLTVRRWRSSETADQPKETNVISPIWVPSHVMSIAGSIAGKGGWRTDREMPGQVLPLEAGQRPGVWHGRETLREAVLSMSFVLQAIPMWTVMSQSDPKPDFQFNSRQLPDLTQKLRIWKLVGVRATQETHVVPIWAWDSRDLFGCEVITGKFSDTDGHDARWALQRKSLLNRVGIQIIINQGLLSYRLVLVLSLASRWQQAVQMGSLPPTGVFWA